MTTTSVTKHPVAVSLCLIQDELGAFFYERKSCLHGAVLALLTGQHGFILGSPGTGKTMLIIELFKRFVGARIFKAALAKDLPTEAVLGPWNLPRLREHGDFIRKVEGFVPTAHLAMLDEMGKASATLCHNLLPIMNERVLYQVDGSGRSAIDVPLSTIFTGSNEELTQDNDDQAATWDRLLVRIQVQEIQEIGNLIASLRGPAKPAPGTTIDWAAMEKVIAEDVPAVVVPDDVWVVLGRLIQDLRDAEIEVSRRRMGQAVTLMQANAFLEGRAEVTTDDIEVLKFALWDTSSQIPKVERLTLKVSNPIAEQALEILGTVNEISDEIRNAKGLALEKKAALATELGGRLTVADEDLAALLTKAGKRGASSTKIEEVKSQASAVRTSLFTELMGFDPASLR